MQKVGTAAEQAAFEAALSRSHTRRVTVSVTDLNGRVLAALTPVLLDGQIVVDTDAEVSRSATLSFLDPAHALSFDTDSPDDGALYADRMVKVDYAIHVEALGRYVSVTVFLGPVTKLDRAGDVVNIEAQGKESMGRGAIWRTLALKKGLRNSDAIKVLLKDRMGETQFSFATTSARLPKTRSLDRYAEVWATAKGFATGVNRQLFYDGAGVATLRTPPGRPLFRFRAGQGGNVVSDVQVSYEMSDIKNVVVVQGGTPKGSKKRARYVAVAPSSHPLSPARLGPTGHPRYLVEVVEDDSIRSNAAAKRKAEALLANRLREPVEVTFDALPIPHLDPSDLVRIESPDFSTSFILRRFTLPLGTSGNPVMNVGYLKRSTPNRKRIRK